jgi:hypothetical protein
MNGKPKAPERAHLEELLDEALAGTFPASDPVSALSADREAPPSAGTAGGPASDEREQEPDEQPGRDRLQDEDRLPAGIQVPEDHRIDDVERRRGEPAAQDDVHRARPAGRAHEACLGTRVGRRSSTPPQFGHLPSSWPCAQAAQNVHS